MTVRCAIAGAIALALLSFAPRARAQMNRGAGAGGRGLPSTQSEYDAKTSTRSVKLFDTKRSTQHFQIALGPIWSHKVGSREGFERGTGELRLGATVTTPWKPFYLAGSQETNLRIFGGDAAAWSILFNQISAGIVLGPFQPEVRLGLSLLTVDVFKGDWSVEALSPRVSFGTGLKLGTIRLDIHAHSEYLWRWFGPDYTIRGITFGIRLEVPRPKPRPTL